MNRFSKFIKSNKEKIYRIAESNTFKDREDIAAIKKNDIWRKETEWDNRNYIFEYSFYGAIEVPANSKEEVQTIVESMDLKDMIEESSGVLKGKVTGYYNQDGSITEIEIIENKARKK